MRIRFLAFRISNIKLQFRTLKFIVCVRLSIPIAVSKCSLEQGSPRAVRARAPCPPEWNGSKVRRRGCWIGNHESPAAPRRNGPSGEGSYCSQGSQGKSYIWVAHKEVSSISLCSLGQISKSRLAGPAQSPCVDIPQRTAVSGAWRAVGERAGELRAHTMGHRPEISDGDHWELSKNRFDRNYVQHRLFWVQLV